MFEQYNEEATVYNRKFSNLHFWALLILTYIGWPFKVKLFWPGMRVLREHTKSQKVWPWKVILCRSNKQSPKCKFENCDYKLWPLNGHSFIWTSCLFIPQQLYQMCQARKKPNRSWTPQCHQNYRELYMLTLPCMSEFSKMNVFLPTVQDIVDLWVMGIYGDLSHRIHLY